MLHANPVPNNHQNYYPKEANFHITTSTPKFETMILSATPDINQFSGPTIRVRINDKSYSALIDTGAVISIISKDLIANFPTFKNEIVRLRSVSNHILDDEGFAIVDLQIGTTRLTYPFIVVSNSKIDILLGYEFIDHFGITIDAANKLLSGKNIPNSPVTVPDIDIIAKLGLSKYIKCTNNQPTIVEKTNKQNHITTHQHQISMQTDFLEADKIVPTSASFRTVPFCSVPLRSQNENTALNISKNFMEGVQTMDNHYNQKVQNSMTHPTRKEIYPVDRLTSPESRVKDTSCNDVINSSLKSIKNKHDRNQRHIITCVVPTLVSEPIKGSSSKVPSSQPSKISFIRLAKTVEIPARSRIQVPIHSVTIEDGQVAVISPCFRLHKSSGIIIPLMAISNKTNYVEIFNSADELKVLSSHTKLGKINSMTSVHDMKQFNSRVNQVDAYINSISMSSNLSQHEKEAIISKIQISTFISLDSRHRLKNLLNQHLNIFESSHHNIMAKKFQHHIDTGNSLPTHCKPNRLSERENEVIQQRCQKLINRKLIEPSSSPWSSNCFLIPNKELDGSLTYKLVMDYSTLNKLTKPMPKHLPNLQATLKKIKGVKYISCLEISHSYYQVPLDDASKEKTAFVTRDNLYHWNVIPYGVHSTTSIFAQLYAKALQDITDDRLALYNNIIFVYTQTEDDHIAKLTQLFNHMQDAGLHLKPSHCLLMFHELNFAGHNIQQQGVLPNDEHVRALTQIRHPVSRQELHKILGFFNFFRRFIRNYAKVTKPLKQLLNKEVKYIWTDEHQNIFDELKRLLTTAPVLSNIQPDGELILRTDASIEGIAACLSQISSGVEKPICFISRSLNPAEKNYSITMLETLAVVWSLQKLRHLLFQRKIKCYTDHKAITYLVKCPKIHLPSRLARMLISLEEFDVDFYHVSGRAHEVPDTLSRFPVDPPEPENPNIVEIPLLSFGFENLNEIQNCDMEIRRIKHDVKYQVSNNHSNHMFLKDGVLLNQSPQQDRAVVVLPSHLRQPIISQIHDDPTLGHLGHSKTYDTIASKYYWPRMKQDIKSFVRSCEECQSPSERPAPIQVCQNQDSDDKQNVADLFMKAVRALSSDPQPLANAVPPDRKYFSGPPGFGRFPPQLEQIRPFSNLQYNSRSI